MGRQDRDQRGAREDGQREQAQDRASVKHGVDTGTSDGQGRHWGLGVPSVVCGGCVPWVYRWSVLVSVGTLIPAAGSCECRGKL